MTYYVVAPDGQKYGPADEAMLNAWILDDRLYPQTIIEEEGTARRMPASAVPTLRFAPVAPPVPAVGAYPRYGNLPPSAPIPTHLNATEHGNFLGALGLGIGAVVVSFFIGYGSLVLSLWSVRLAWRAKEDDDHPAWWFALIFAIVALGVAGYLRANGRH